MNVECGQYPALACYGTYMRIKLIQCNCLHISLFIEGNDLF
jgi:hypothetical protein